MSRIGDFWNIEVNVPKLEISMSCTFIETFELLKRADNLIRLKATGNPVFFAEKLNISERSLYILLQQLKEIGAPIAYSRVRESYFYTQPTILKLGYEVVKMENIFE